MQIRPLARAGMLLVMARRILGQSDAKLTAAIYSHLDWEDLRGAIGRIERIGATNAVKPARVERA